MFVTHLQRHSAVLQALLRLGQADAAARFNVGVAPGKFALILGILRAHAVLQKRQRFQQLLVRELFDLWSATSRRKSKTYWWTKFGSSQSRRRPGKALMGAVKRRG